MQDQAICLIIELYRSAARAETADNTAEILHCAGAADGSVRQADRHIAGQRSEIASPLPWPLPWQ